MRPSNPLRTARRRDATEIPNCKRSVCSLRSLIQTPLSCSERNSKDKGYRHMKNIDHRNLRSPLLVGIALTLGATFIGCGGGGGASVQQQPAQQQQQPTSQSPAPVSTPLPTNSQNQSRTSINNRNTGSGQTTGAGTNGGYVPRARQQPSPSPTASNAKEGSGGYVPRARKP